MSSSSLATIDGRLYIIGGKSRSGKTSWTARQIRSVRRILAWDPDDQYSQLPGFRRVTRPAQLKAIADNPNPGRYAFVPSGDLKESFDFFCECAFHWGRFAGGGAVIAEELADVSSPGKAPNGWGKLCRRGLKRSLDIYAISQRWAEADKTAFGNASEYIIFMLASQDDVAYLAKKSRIPIQDIETLERFEFIRLDTDTREIRRDKLRFPRG
jgi:hypothetical protein